MQKKGQIGIFIVIGFVIFIAAGFIIYLNSSSKVAAPEITEVSESSLASLPVKSYVESCIKNTAREGLVYIGLQGGYYQNPPIFEDYSLLSIPYYFYLGTNHFPSIEVIEKELSKYIVDTLPYCIDDFKSFKEIGYIIDYSNTTITSTSKIRSDDVSVAVIHPVKIKKDEEGSEIKEFLSTVDIKFKDTYSILEKIAFEQQKDTGFMPIGFIMDSAVLNNYTFEIINLEGGSVIYTLIFNNIKINNEPYIFDFAVKYDWSSINQSQPKVVLYDTPNMTAVVGEKFIYHVKAFGNNIVYKAYTGLFDIDSSSGLIEFTPKELDKGLHRIIIKVVDSEGNEDLKFLKLTIVAENEPPTIKKIANQTVNMGQTFFYKVDASDPNGDTLLYNVETSLSNFKIHPLSGEINFKPESSQRGNYTITVVVVDIKGSTDKQTFKLEVK